MNIALIKPYQNIGKAKGKDKDKPGQQKEPCRSVFIFDVNGFYTIHTYTTPLVKICAWMASEKTDTKNCFCHKLKYHPTKFREGPCFVNINK